MAGRSKRYLVEFDGKRVSELGSLAGLRIALTSLEQGGTTTLSLAYPRDGEWLRQWAEAGGGRVVVVKDTIGAEAFVLHVVELRDASGDGQVFEALVDRVRRHS